MTLPEVQRGHESTGDVSKEQVVNVRPAVTGG